MQVNKMESLFKNSNSPQPVLEADKLTKRYDNGVLAVDNTSFKVYPGQIYAMLGANGAGKTTLIHLFLNFIEPTQGVARIDGVGAQREPLFVKQRLAYVSENVMLYSNFTPVQNLDYFCKLAGHNHYTRQDYEATLSRVGLQSSSFTMKLKDFSKGMRQKCGIAIAILKNAPVILLDEPTSGLDPKAGHDFIQLLAELRQEGKAILMSTHDIFRARQVADTVGIMRSGKLLVEYTQMELEQKNLEQLYLDYMMGETEN